LTAPIAVQLYSVREAAAKDYAAAVRQIASFGYVGVEPAGFPGTTAEAAGKLYRELGLQVPSAHTALPVGDKQNEVFDAMEAIGCKHVISGFGPDSFNTLDRIKQTCATFNEAAANSRTHGLTFGIHNHWWEYQQVEGRWVYQLMLELLDPSIFFELDTYWIRTAGCDPAMIVTEFGKRAPYLHIKDGPCQKGQPMTAVGDGVMDMPALVKAGEKTVDWLIVELDECATDMMAAVHKSIQYLTSTGLGYGRKS
jgi:sugar phosphate isomerase/epimerase